MVRESWLISQWRNDEHKFINPDSEPKSSAIAPPSQHAQETISHMAAVREAGRQMAEKLKAEQLPPDANIKLTKAELVDMVRARDKEIADLKSRLKRQNETPVIYTKK